VRDKRKHETLISGENLVTHPAHMPCASSRFQLRNTRHSGAPHRQSTPPQAKEIDHDADRDGQGDIARGCLQHHTKPPRVSSQKSRASTMDSVCPMDLACWFTRQIKTHYSQINKGHSISEKPMPTQIVHLSIVWSIVLESSTSLTHRRRRSICDDEIV
jgi:hypothetical protein